MPFIWVVLPLGAICVLLLAFAIAGLVQLHLQEAMHHENTVLPALHIAWIVTVAFFAYHGFVFF